MINIIANMDDSGVVKNGTLIIFTGESNSGGRALNSDATAPELAARPGVQILNNDTLVFEDLNIGTNNLLGHTALTSQATTEHSWELGLANQVEAGDLPQVHLVKTGQGGSTISQWGTGGGYYTTLINRVDTALDLLSGFSLSVVIWYSQGINDIIAGTSSATWKAATKTHLQNLQTAYNCPIIMMKMMDGRNSYNATMDEIASEMTDVYSINPGGTTLEDTNHWDYESQKLNAAAFITKTLEIL